MGAFALAEALHGNGTLTELRLDDNLVGREGLEALCAALTSNRTLARLTLGGNPALGAADHRALALALKTRQHRL